LYTNTHLGTIDQLLSFFQPYRQRPVANARARVCQISDPQCTTPVAEGLEANAEGIITFTVPGNFHGYLDVTADGFYPAIAVINPTRKLIDVMDVPTFRTSDLVLMVSLTGQLPEANRSQILGQFFDCEFNPLANMAAEIPDVNATIHYLSTVGSPISDATGTSATGIWSAYNVEPRSQATVLYMSRNGERIGSSDLVLRAGYISAMGVMSSSVAGTDPP
jgi:hypothetical protein